MRVINALFTVMALVIMGYAVSLDWQYDHSGSGSGGAPSPATPVLSQEERLGQGNLSPLIIAISAVKHGAVAGFPWFIYAAGGAGAYLLLTALVGFSGVRNSSR